MHNGVPFDVAFSVSDTYRAAFAIIFSEMHGNEFDADLMEFKKRT